MKNSSNKSVKANKNVIATKESVKAEESRLTEINLQQFADKLSHINLKEKKTKETLYNYPEDWTKEMINSDKGKQFRNKLRSKLKSLSNNIFYYAKTQNVDAIKKEIDTFDSFYKANYRLNDYSIRSLTNSEKKEKDIEIMLEIIKSVKA